MVWFKQTREATMWRRMRIEWLVMTRRLLRAGRRHQQALGDNYPCLPPVSRRRQAWIPGLGMLTGLFFHISSR